MTDPTQEPEEQAQAFLRDLVDTYGVDGLMERLSAAIAEAEAGRVTGPALDEATTWLDEKHGAWLGFAGEGHLSFGGFAGGAATAGTASLSLSGSGQAFGQDVASATDQASVAVSEAAHVVVLPGNVEVMTLFHDTFWYLVNAMSLMQVPPEALPFILLATLAIVIARIRVRRAEGG